MKKLLKGIMSLMMLISLAACAKAPTEASQDTKPVVQKNENYLETDVVVVGVLVQVLQLH